MSRDSLRTEVDSPPPPSTGRKETLRVLLLAALGAILAVFWAQQLWRVEDWRTPLAWHDGGDALFNVLLAQNIQETGWYLENPRLGAPGTLDLYSFPATILGPMVAFKALGALLPAPGAIVNAYYLLGWPLAAMIAAWVLLRLGLQPPLATAMGVLFAALPAHTIRGEPHLFLATLALVPPGLLVAHALARQGLGTKGRSGALALALLLGASEAYYGFFATILVCVGAAIGWCARRRARVLLDAAFFALFAVAGIVLATLPTLLHGSSELVRRAPADASLLGLKLGQLLLPVPGHRFPPFARLSQSYLAGGAAPGLDTESVASALGLLGSFSLLLLLADLVGARLPSRRPETTHVLAGLALAALLFSMTGGFGSLFVTFVSPQLRGLNRMSVFVAFLALAALGLWLDKLLGRLPGGARGGRAWSCAALVTLFGVWDQSSLIYVPDHRANAADWEMDREWAGRAEAALPPAAMVFVLPWIPFPESPAQQGIFNFDELRPILQSRSLRWSYGTTKNSPSDLRLQRLAGLPPPEMVTELRAAGFAAVVLDRHGYEENSLQMASALRSQLGVPRIASRDHRWELFPLSHDRARDAAAEPADPELFGDGFESGASNRWMSPTP